MNAHHAIQWVPATPEYILACLREEWQELAVQDDEKPLPDFATTVQEWREAMDLVWWSPLGQSLNKEWRTNFSELQWFRTLVPARERTLRDVCNLLASRAQRPVVVPTRWMGRNCPAASLFLAIRALLVQAGAPQNLRPSTPLRQFLKKWPDVFRFEISRLAPGGLPLLCENKWRDSCVALAGLFALVLLTLCFFTDEPLVEISAAVFFAVAWFGGVYGHRWFRGRMRVEDASTFRDLARRILERQQRNSVQPFR